MLERIFDHIGGLFIMSCWVVVFSFIRWLLGGGRRTVIGFVISMVISVPTGVLIGSIAKEWGVKDMTATGVACLCAIMAHDIILFLITNKAKLGEWVDIAVKGLINRVIGR